MTVAEQVKQVIADEALIHNGDCIVVAVSGGPDSVALLHILFSLKEQYGWSLVVAHVNHRFRGEEADRESDFVAELAATLGLPCEVGIIDVPAYIAQSGLNGQVAAREKRYEFLHRVAEQYGAQRIALAHHAGDQAETVMMRIIRGTGPTGLAGIPERRKEKYVELIRPLLRIKKEDLIAYCHNHQISYCTDSSNLKRSYLRNVVRLDILPYLQQFNEQLPDALCRLAEVMRDEENYMHQETLQVMNDLVEQREHEYSFDRIGFIRLSIALQRRVIKLILNYLVFEESLDFAKLETVRELIVRESPTTQTLGLYPNLHIVREYNRISFMKKLDQPEAFFYRLERLEDTTAVNAGNMSLTFRAMDRFADELEYKSDYEAWFDLEQLSFPIIIRSRQNGDRIELFGLNGSKKVKNMFIDAKVPPRARNHIPILSDDEHRILWIPGFRQSRHAGVNAGTQRILHVKAEPLD